MDHFAGLDVSVKETSVCIVDDTGRIVREVKVASEPEALLRVLTNPAYRFKRIGLEAGPLSQWLFSVLTEAGLPVICVETRHMKAVLKAQINKTDRNDARGMAQMMRVGLYRPVHVKTLRSQKLRMLLTHRKLLQRGFAMTKVASADLQHQIDKMLELEIVHARRDVDTVAGVEADMVFRDAAQCVIERLDAKRDELAAVVDRGVDLTIVVRRHPRIVDLQDEPGVGNRQVLDPHRLAERHQVLLIRVVIVVLVVELEVRRRDRGHGGFCGVDALERSLQVRDPHKARYGRCSGLGRRRPARVAAPFASRPARRSAPCA